MDIKNLFYFCAVLFMASYFCHDLVLNDNADNTNLYILHTKNGNIRCNYHDSRDLTNGWMFYYQGSTYYKIKASDIDSVTVLSENILTCGPRSNTLKYIDKRNQK